MSWTAILFVGVALALIALGAAIGELGNQIRQIRAVLHMQDTPLPVDLATAGRQFNDLVPDRPNPHPAEPWVLLVLSTTCSVCADIAGAVAPLLVRSADEAAGVKLHIVVHTNSDTSFRRFVADTGLNEHQLNADQFGSLSQALGVTQSPTAVAIGPTGLLRSAATVTTVTQLETFMDATAKAAR